VCLRPLLLYRCDAVVGGGITVYGVRDLDWIIKRLLKAMLSASAHMSSNVTFLSEYPSFQRLRRNELSLILSPVMQNPNHAEAAYKNFP